jgi:uncharacterized oligopeptide transporter (OPT) family protein
VGGLTTLLFTAANVRLAVKVRPTFATSIPTSCHLVEVLRLFGDHTIGESKGQTIESAGTVSS